jgi:hypothetical protein
MEDSSRNKVNDAFAVTRTIPVTPAGPIQLESVIRSLQQIECIAYARALGNGRLRIRYDGSVIGFHDVEGMLKEAGVQLHTDFWWRLKSAWYAFLDRNARSNAIGGGGACCNKPPGIEGGRHRDAG